MPENNSDQKQYDKWWTDFISANIDDPGTIFRTNLIIKIIKKLKVQNILDAGCGSAELIKKILNKTENVKVSGFDVSQKVIELNKEKYNEADFFCLNLNEDNQKVDKKFDMVICCEVIEHLRNWEKAINTLSKFVSNDGYIIITTQAGKIYEHHKALDHLKHFKKEEIEEQLKNNGMNIVESRYCGWPFMNLKNILANLFFKNIESSLLKSEKQSWLNKLAFRIFKYLYDISSMGYGPQIVVIGKNIND